jgi:hypothetical protein
MPRDPTRRFEADELRRFLSAVDRYLSEPVAITVLGGSAIALHGVTAGTIDIDTWETDLSKLRTAIDRARADTGLHVPVSDTPTADVPYDYEDRLHTVPGTWTRLQVRILERHDLALSKAVRGYENDLAAIAKLHAIAPLDRQTLVARYRTEMRHAVGNRARRDANLAVLVERLFGEIDAEIVADELAAARAGHAR